MNQFDVDNVCKYLGDRGIHLTLNNRWLNSCINYYKSHLDLGNIYGSLQEYVCIQWLLTDLQDIKQGSLPANCLLENMILTGKYSVQINWIRDIGQSCYSQLQSLQNLNESNVNVSAEEHKKQHWEPNPKRMLLMEITDGVITLKGTEYSPITKLCEPFLPGLKVVLTGPIECRKGMLFIKNNNITLLGGEVDYLYEANSKENLLRECLNLPTNDHDAQTRAVNGSLTSSIHNETISEYERPQVLNDIEQLPDSTSMIEHSPLVEDREILSSVGGDEFICQLPNEIPHDIDDMDSSINDLSPVLNYGSNINYQDTLRPKPIERNSTCSSNQNSLVPSNKKTKLNKAKLFPSLEDLHHVGEEITSVNKSPQLPMTRINISQNHSINTSTEINPSSDIKHRTDTTLTSFSPNKRLDKLGQNSSRSSLDLNYINISNSYNNDTIVDSVSNKEADTFHNMANISTTKKEYPQFKKVNIKVESITKLKIRNGEWNCCATVSLADQLLEVTFNNEVLGELFGMTASEAEVLRNEMATNPSLKKKINDILKAGQTKLKILNCPMTLEYSSENCVPNVVTIHST